MEEYTAAVERLTHKRVSLERIWKEGLDDTNGDLQTDLVRGSMKLIAAADFLVNEYQGARELTSSDVENLFKASRGYHFAANTLRRLQQFELSADFYQIAGWIGDATLHHTTCRDYKNQRTLKELAEFAIRSFTRSRTSYREFGSDDKAECVYVRALNFEALWAKRRRKCGKAFRLFLWKWFSRYGTSLGFLFVWFIAWIVIVSLYLGLTGTANDLGDFHRYVFGALRLTLGSSRSVATETATVTSSPWIIGIDILLRMFGFLWTAMLAQLVIHKTLARA